MLNTIWPILVLVSIFFGVINGRSEQVGAAVFSGAGTAISLCITLAAVMSFWSGIMKIAEKAGITMFLSRAFRPAFRLLFPGLAPESEAGTAICMNISANMLGLGNAATPFGITAMKRLHKLGGGETADSNMITFVVLNTASVQLLPTTIAGMRAAAGSSAPMEILPAVLISSFLSLSVALVANSLLRRLWR